MPAMTIRSCMLITALAVLLPACTPAVETALDDDFAAMTTKVQPDRRTTQNSAPALQNRPNNRANDSSVLIVSEYQEHPFTGRLTIDWKGYFRAQPPVS